MASWVSENVIESEHGCFRDLSMKWASRSLRRVDRWFDREAGEREWRIEGSCNIVSDCRTVGKIRTGPILRPLKNNHTLDDIVDVNLGGGDDNTSCVGITKLLLETSLGRTELPLRK